MDQAFQYRPLLGMCRQVRAVRRQIRQPQLAKAPAQSLADLASNPPEACPPQAESRKRPLQERDALRGSPAPPLTSDGCQLTSAPIRPRALDDSDSGTRRPAFPNPCGGMFPYAASYCPAFTR